MTIGFTRREACPACAAAPGAILYELAYDDPRLRDFIASFYRGRVPASALSGQVYRVRECPRCRLLYQDPILDEAGMAALYQDWIDQHRSLEKKRSAADRLQRKYAGHLATLKRLFPRPPAEIRVLDFGMGWGYWSLGAQNEGYDVRGYELAAERQQHARELGVRVIDRLDCEVEKYDFIFANQVFEHLPDPRAALTTLVACLRPGGVVYLRVPDGRGVATTLRASGWQPRLDAVHPLEHINCFTRRGLIDFAGRCGLRAFNPPPRFTRGRLWGSLKREFADRYRTTHVYFRV